MVGWHNFPVLAHKAHLQQLKSWLGQRKDACQLIEAASTPLQVSWEVPAKFSQYGQLGRAGWEGGEKTGGQAHGHTSLGREWCQDLALRPDLNPWPSLPYTGCLELQKIFCWKVALLELLRHYLGERNELLQGASYAVPTPHWILGRPAQG